MSNSSAPGSSNCSVSVVSPFVLTSVATIGLSVGLTFLTVTSIVLVDRPAVVVEQRDGDRVLVVDVVIGVEVRIASVPIVSDVPEIR